MLNEAQAEFALHHNLTLIPLARHRANAELVGLVRLTHRARTTATADWLAKSEVWQKWAETYEQIGQDLYAEELARSKGDQGGINGESKGHQRGVNGG